MIVTPEVINLIVNIVGVSLTVLGGAWLLLRHNEKKNDARFDHLESRTDARFSRLESKTDARFDQLESKTDARFDRLESKTDARFNHLESKTGTRFDRLDDELREVRRDLSDIKERVARLEGPQKQLQLR